MVLSKTDKMSSYDVAKSSKLTFKGEKSHKKKKHSKKRKAETDEQDAQPKLKLRHGKWWQATDVEQLSGPVLIQASDGKYLFATETAQFQVGELRDADDKADIDPAEVFTVVALGGGKVALKSGYDRYVGTTVHGKLVGFKEAIDQLETWTAELDEEGGIHLRSAIGGKYLTYVGDGQWTCEAKEAGDATRLLVWCGKDREVKKAKVEKFEGSLGTLELDNIKRYQSWKMNKIVMPDGDRKELYQARKEGLLNEALLDRRSKTKSDKYCK